MCPTSSLGRSTRWCPTAEQVMLLEEMYKGGLRNPTASQIHQITAHLLRFGKVQGKNIFYWFQNHKARDKQRLKKKLVRQPSCYYANLPEQGPASCISFTRPLIVTNQPGTETVDATTCYKTKPNECRAMRDNVLIWSGMYGSHDHRKTSTSMLGQEGPVSYFRSSISQGRPRLQTLDLFPVTATNIKNREELKLPCLESSDAGSLDFDLKPSLSLSVRLEKY